MMKRLLIVDDDPDHRLILRIMLEAKGYACEEAGDADTALSILETDQIDLVLTDLNMPGMNGLHLIDHMGKISQLDKVLIILMTSQSMEDMSAEANKAGAWAILSKPYEFSKLLEEVGRAIGQVEPLCNTSRS